MQQWPVTYPDHPDKERNVTLLSKVECTADPIGAAMSYLPARLARHHGEHRQRPGASPEHYSSCQVGQLAVAGRFVRRIPGL
ncbi:hypothetical protein [Amycolatopsis australiensis]|uniref:hypothetical protein n=1 Tax=Amycolatopsis australiensis TaxID=546364 RepID=UPI0011611D88|nr:hypothetical protein [Amycolatopsis australiensis]